jgi:hypothetical protein
LCSVESGYEQEKSGRLLKWLSRQCTWSFQLGFTPEGTFWASSSTVFSRRRIRSTSIPRTWTFSPSVAEERTFLKKPDGAQSRFHAALKPASVKVLGNQTASFSQESPPPEFLRIRARSHVKRKLEEIARKLD